MFTIDTHSPERGWQPFIDWLTSQRIDATQAQAITIDPATMTAVVTLFRYRHGRRYMQDGRFATEDKAVSLTSLPPRR